MPSDLQAGEIGNRMHVDHCIEALRISLMCHADTTPYLVINDPTAPNGQRADFSPHHKCRKFEPIRKWTRENQLSVPDKKGLGIQDDLALGHGGGHDHLHEQPACSKPWKLDLEHSGQAMSSVNGIGHTTQMLVFCCFAVLLSSLHLSEPCWLFVLPCSCSEISEMLASTQVRRSS